MWRIKIVMIVCGVLLGIWSVKELLLSAGASEKPQELTCAELIADGPGDNAHIVLKDFVACPTWYIYKGASENGPYEWVYLPALELGGDWHRKAVDVLEKEGENAELPAPDDIRLLLKLNDVHTPTQLERVVEADTLHGLIINSTESLGAEEQKLLRQGYPGIDFSKCYILEVGRRPKSSALTAAATLGSAVLVLGGLGWMVWPTIRNRRVKQAAMTPPPVQAQPDSAAGAPEPEDKNPYAQR
jgi:hypothetical protein